MKSKQKGNSVFVLFLFLFVMAFLAVILLSGCKKEKEEINETTLAEEATDIDRLIDEIEGLDIDLDLGEEWIGEEESMLS